MALPHPLPQSLVDRFWKYVKRLGPNDCWPWTGQKREGYGMLFFMSNPKTRTVAAHRVSFVIAYGPIPKNKPVVMHSCDNPTCVNPNHLSAGTIADNMHDRNRKNRQVKGEASGRSKLTTEDVLEIRRIRATRQMKLKDLATRYGMTLDQVHRIATGKSWRHINACV